MRRMAGRRDELQRIAAEKFGWSQLTGEQLAAMEQVMAGHDVLAVLPTGAGTGAVGVTADGRLEYRDADVDPGQVAEAHQRLIRSRIEMMRGYAETTGCRRQFLLGYFGEQLEHPCGNCDTCIAGTAEALSAGDVPSRSTAWSSTPSGAAA